MMLKQLGDGSMEIPLRDVNPGGPEMALAPPATHSRHCEAWGLFVNSLPWRECALVFAHTSGGLVED